MRAIDTAAMEIVSVGLPWRHAISPCSKQAIALLERNTKVVTWLMPKGGRPQDQLPCIFYKGRHYSLSLRMQKAIYRHIRLKKGFKNEEVVDGTAKLRIPDLLLKEKIRTQSRFDVSMARCARPVIRARAWPRLTARSLQAMRQHQHPNNNNKPPPESRPDNNNNDEEDEDQDQDNEPPQQPPNHQASAAKRKKAKLAHPSAATTTAQQQQPAAAARRERTKSANTVAARMKGVVEKMIQERRARDPHPHLTVFVYRNQQSEITNAFLQELQKENPGLFRSRDAFLALLMERYDEFHHHNVIASASASAT